MKRHLMNRVVRKGLCLGVSVVLATGAAVPPALAYAGGGALEAASLPVQLQAASTWTPPSSAVPIDGNVVTAGAHESATALPDMLGLNGTVLPDDLLESTASSGAVQAKSTSQIRSTNRLGVYGSDSNTNPNPYLANGFYGLASAGPSAQRDDAAIVDTTGYAVESDFKSQALSGYGVSADLVRRPDVVVGVSGSSGAEGKNLIYNASTSNWTNYGTWANSAGSAYQSRLVVLNMRRWTDNDSLAGQKNSDGNAYEKSSFYRAGDNSYNPIAMEYQPAGSLNPSLRNAYQLAYDAKLVMQQNAAKKVRYGDPVKIANDLEAYAKASKWYVLSRVAAGDRKTVAFVDRVKDGKFYLVKMNPDGDDAEFASAFAALDAAQDTVVDLAATLGSGGSASPGDVDGVSATASQLAQADVVICMPKWADSYDASAASVRSALSSANIGASDMPEIFDWTIPLGTFENNLLFCNSEESTMLVGLIQGFLYPAQIDPVDMMAYYASTFFHLKSNALKPFVKAQLEGVSLPAGVSADDDSHYTSAALGAVAEKLDAGVSYYYANKSAIDAARPKIASTDGLDDANGVDVHDVAISVPAGAVATVRDNHGLAVSPNSNGTYTLDSTDDSTLDVAMSGYRMNTRTIKGNESNVTVTTSDMVAVKRVMFSLPAGASVAVRSAGKAVKAAVDGGFWVDRDASSQFTVSMTGYEPYTRSIASGESSISVSASQLTRAKINVQVSVPTGAALTVLDASGAKMTATATVTDGSGSTGTYLMEYGSKYTLSVTLAGYKAYAKVITPGATVSYTVRKSDMEIDGKTSITLNKTTVTENDISSADAKTLTTVTLGSKVKTISAGTFSDCKKLATVKFGANVTTIGKGAFLGCSNLTTVTLGSKVTSVGESAFSGCTKLSKVTLGSKVGTVGKRAFAGCTALKSLTLPAGVKTVGTYAFSGAKKLTTLTLKTKKLTKKGVYGSLASSSVKTVKVAVGASKANKTYVTKYKKFFTKANCGKSVSVKR